MKKIAFLISLILIYWNCATFNTSYKLGTNEALNKNWDKAVEHFEEAIIQDPKNSVYRIALFRAKMSASYTHLNKARELVSEGKKQEAIKEYKMALIHNPRSIMIQRELLALTKKEKKVQKPEFKYDPPVRLKSADKKVDLKLFRKTGLLSIFRALGKSEGVNIIFDETFQDIPMSFDFEDMTFEEALKSLCIASNNFYRVVDESTIIVAPDKPAMREKYELKAVKTFYLSNLSAKDIQSPLLQMLRTQFKMPKIIVDERLNAITIKDTPEILMLAENIIKNWDKAKAEVIIDLEIMEISRVKMKKLGLSFDSSSVGVQYTTGTGEETGGISLGDLDFSNTQNIQISLPTAIVDFLESDVDTKIIAQPRLRGIDDEEIKYLVGDKVPVPKTTFSPIAAGGISQQPVTSFDYQDVGIDLKITPNIHHDGEVTMEMEIKIKSLRGTGFADIPIISTREVTNIIRLKEGETNLLAGLLKDEERKTLAGIAGLQSIPLLGGLFSNTDKQIEQTDVVMTVTPYIIRQVSITEKDRRPIWSNIEGITSSNSMGQKDSEQPRAVLKRREEERTQDKEEKNLITLTPTDFRIIVNREFRISVNLNLVQEIGSLSLNIGFDPDVLNLKKASPGRLISQGEEKMPFLENINNSSGVCNIGVSSSDMAQGIQGNGPIAVLHFKAIGKGDTEISLRDVSGYSTDGKTISFDTRNAKLNVR
ncbi:MAG: secretin N-terminal domain-containing protein [Candidatus Aminicenantaceae bacterium]